MTVLVAVHNDKAVLLMKRIALARRVWVWSRRYAKDMQKILAIANGMRK